MSGTPPHSRLYTLKFSTDYDYNYDPDGTKTPPNYAMDPYDPEYCAPGEGTSSSGSEEGRRSGAYSSTLDRLSSVRRLSGSSKHLSSGPSSYPRHHRRPSPPSVPPIPTSPTPEYLQISSQPSPPLSSPSHLRKLLALDLNGTLVYRSPHRARNFPRPPRRGQAPETFDPYSDPTLLRPLRTVHPRPYLGTFVEYLLHPETKEWLDVMVWSSAQPHSVNDMVEKAFGKRKEELKAVWARDTLGLSGEEYHKKSLTTKNLAKPWAELPLSPPASSTSPPSTSPQRHSALTTLLLDDSPRKAHLQPWNHLCIKEYTGDMRKDDLLALEREEAMKKAAAALAAVGATSGNGAGTVEGAAEGSVEKSGAGEGEKAEGKEEKTVEEEKLDPRKEKKKRKRALKASQTAALLASKPEVTYDPTLLAVIGVLDAVKWEGNVAGWMRGGALKTVATATAPGETTTASTPAGETTGTGVDENVGEMEEGTKNSENPTIEKLKANTLGEEASIESLASVSEHPKKRRVSDGGVDEAVSAGVEGAGASGAEEGAKEGVETEPSSPVEGSCLPTSSIPSARTKLPLASSVLPSSTAAPHSSKPPPTSSKPRSTPSPSEPISQAQLASELTSPLHTNLGDSGQWFEDEKIVEGWVRRGIRACEVLGIRVEGGVVRND